MYLGFLTPIFTFLVYHEKISLTKAEAARVNKVFELPSSERNIPSVVTEANLIKIKLLPEEVGTKVGWKRFIDGRPVGEKQKGVKRKRSESSDSEGDDDDDDGKPRPRPFMRARPLNL